MKHTEHKKAWSDAYLKVVGGNLLFIAVIVAILIFARNSFVHLFWIIPLQILGNFVVAVEALKVKNYVYATVLFVAAGFVLVLGVLLLFGLRAANWL